MRPEFIPVRAALFRRTRSFFHTAGYLEVDTPTLSPRLIPEAHIDPFETHFHDPYHEGRSIPLYLVPSPEVHLKPLLGQVGGRLFQLGHCFRNAESVGEQHNPEFTMLEYYECPADERTLLTRTQAFIRSLQGDTILAQMAQRSGADRLFSATAIELRVAEAFERYTGIEITDSESTFVDRCRQFDGSLPEGATWNETFDYMMAAHIEPQLPRDRPVFLTHYPWQAEVLARRADELSCRRRWELYIGGREIANCFAEEQHPARVSEFMHRQNEYRRDRGAAVIRPAVEVAGALRDSEPCAGCALGFDRLLMILCGVNSIEGVIFSPLHDSIRP